MLTLLLTLFPKLVRLLFLYKHLPFLCFSMVLFLLLLGVNFEPNLAPFWGCLNFVSHALVCFIRSLKPSKTRLGKLFTYPLTKLSEI
jgi:hypothetical protein